MSIRVLESPWNVRWSSLAMMAVIVVVVTAIKRRPLLAVAAAMGWLVSYEVVFQATDILVHHRFDAHLASWGFWLLTVAGWPFVAYIMGIRPRLGWTLLSATIFVVWVQQGFWYNWPSQLGPVNWWYEALNVGSKTALGMAYLLGALNPLTSQLEDLKRRFNHRERLWRSVHRPVELDGPAASSQSGQKEPA